MSTNEKITLDNRITLMQQYEAEARAFAEKAKEIEDSIKEMMTERDLSEIVTSNFVVRYIDVLSSRFDTKRFKLDLGEEVYNYYTKQVSSKRFSVTN